MLQKLIKPVKKSQLCPMEQVRNYKLRSRSRDQDKNKSSVSVDFNDFSSEYIQGSEENSLEDNSLDDLNQLFFPEKSKTNQTPQARQDNPIHYPYIVGEKIHEYEVISLLNDGTFGRVLLVQDQIGNQFAMKIVKAVESYCTNAKSEAKTVQTLTHIKSKNEGQKNIVQILEDFEYKGFYCLIFERLGNSLYDVLKHGHFKGFSKKLLALYAKQTLQALTFLHESGITHTDLKPENIMLQQDGSIKVIDFGGATWDTESRIHRINTRQYRAPEVILGCGQWGHPSDIWCLGCIMVELYTGNLFFDQNNCYEHLWMIEQQCGKIPEWMIQMGCFALDSWKSSVVGNFLDLNEIISDEDWVLRDLIELMLSVDPTRRITAKKALTHPFFSGI